MSYKVAAPLLAVLLSAHEELLHMHVPLHWVLPAALHGLPDLPHEEPRSGLAYPVQFADLDAGHPLGGGRHLENDKERLEQPEPVSNILFTSVGVL